MGLSFRLVSRAPVAAMDEGQDRESSTSAGSNRAPSSHLLEIKVVAAVDEVQDRESSTSAGSN